jgi:hypothetical protein
MKKFTIVFCIVGLITSGFAQPVLNYSSTHSIGTQAVWYYIGGTTTALNQSGANVTWDLSANGCTQIGTFNAVDPSTTPYASTYPSANLAYELNQTGTGITYVYHIDSSTELNQMAQDIGGTSPVIYSNYKKELQYPFSYTNSFIDTYQTTTGSPITDTITYDAYGTLIINGKTYTNVIRSGATGDKALYITSPVIFPIVFTSGGYYFYNEPTTIGIDNLLINVQITVYPNPAKDRLTVQLSNCDFSKEIKLTIINNLGQTIKQIQIFNALTSIELDNFTHGLYFYQLQNNQTILKTGKVIIE